MGNGIGISVIIPNYNGAELLINNIPSVIRELENYPDSEIIIVDDASTDNSLAVVKKYFPAVRILSNAENFGFARSVNNGIKASKSDLVLFLNNDISLDNDFFIHQVPYFRQEDTFGVMGAIKAEESGRIQEGLKYPYFTFSEIRYKDLDVPDSHHGHWIPTLYLCGGNALIDRKKLLELDGLSLRYEPFYNEDLDLSLRAWMRGWKCYYEPRSSCIHRRSVTIRKYYDERFIHRISRRNRLMLNYLYLDTRLKRRFLLKFQIKYRLYQILNRLGIPTSYLSYRDFKMLMPGLKREITGKNFHGNDNLTMIIGKIKSDIDKILAQD